MASNEDMKLEAINIITRNEVKSYEIGAALCPDAESWGSPHHFSLPRESFTVPSTESCGIKLLSVCEKAQNNARRALSGLSANITSPRKPKAQRPATLPPHEPPRKKMKKKTKKEETDEEVEEGEKAISEMNDEEFNEWLKEN